MSPSLVYLEEVSVSVCFAPLRNLCAHLICVKDRSCFRRSAFCAEIHEPYLHDPAEVLVSCCRTCGECLCKKMSVFISGLILLSEKLLGGYFSVQAA